VIFSLYPISQRVLCVLGAFRLSGLKIGLSVGQKRAKMGGNGQNWAYRPS